MLVWHRRAGKTVAAITDLIVRALEAPEDARFAYVAPTFTQAKDVAWAYLTRFVRGIPGKSQTHETELRVTLPNGAGIRLYGAENPDRLRGLYLDGVVLDEPAQQPERLWSEVLRPALSDRKGWALWIGTPQGRNAFANLWERSGQETGWYRSLLRASESGVLPEAELESARLAMSHGQYRQEYECDFDAPVEGSYYSEELEQAEREGRISRGVWEPGAEVHTAWDLGIGDATSIIWWQIVGREPRIVEGYSSAGQGLSHYAEVLKAKAYTYGTNYLPHDAGHKQLGDHAGRSLAEQLGDYGIRNVEVLPRADVEPGIEETRQLLRIAWIEREKCAEALAAWKAYRREWDDKNRVWRPKPKHDWSSHYSDALRYLAAAWADRKGSAAEMPRMPRVSWDSVGVGWMS